MISPADGWWQQRGYARASIDFCESNYAFSHYVAEPLNAASALPYLALGWYGATTVGAGGERWERVAFRLAYWLIALIGVGTMALHGTLTAPGQALDEIPMLILSQTLLFIILEVESGPVLTRPWLPKAMASSCVVSIAVYLKFQAFYGAFLFVYISTVVLIVGGSWRLAFTPKETAAAETARTELVKPLVLAGIAAYVCGGSVAWLLEMAFCEQVSRILGPAFLHPLWHMGALVGTWCCLQMLRAARLAARRRTPALEWHFGCVPIVTAAPKARAGGIVVRRAAGGGEEVLLISSRKQPSLWIIPAGTVEKGEALPEAALREVSEEAGAACALAEPEPLGTYTDADRRNVTTIYVMTPTRLRDTWEDKDTFRRREWWRFEEAVGSVKPRDRRPLLDYMRRARAR